MPPLRISPGASLHSRHRSTKTPTRSPIASGSRTNSIRRRRNYGSPNRRGLTGSHGTLSIITEITLKVLPAPEAPGTLVLPGLDAVAGVAALSDALGSPYSVSGA